MNKINVINWNNFSKKTIVDKWVRVKNLKSIVIYDFLGVFAIDSSIVETTKEEEDLVNSKTVDEYIKNEKILIEVLEKICIKIQENIKKSFTGNIVSKNEIYKKAIEKYGNVAQVDMIIEEMAELTKALLKYRRLINELKNNILEECIALDNVIEEMVDVEIMLEQAKIIFGNKEQFEKVKKEKLERLEGRIK